jgi:hypothetical protein
MPPNVINNKYNDKEQQQGEQSEQLHPRHNLPPKSLIEI